MRNEEFPFPFPIFCYYSILLFKMHQLFSDFRIFVPYTNGARCKKCNAHEHYGFADVQVIDNRPLDAPYLFAFRFSKNASFAALILSRIPAQYRIFNSRAAPVSPSAKSERFS